jgi:hypothetical protein
MANRILVDTPAAQTPIGGLFSVANVVEESDPHASFSGIELVPDPTCNNGTAIWPVGPCSVPLDIELSVTTTVTVPATDPVSWSLAPVLTITGGLAGIYTASIGADVQTGQADGTAPLTLTFDPIADVTVEAPVTVTVTDPSGNVFTVTVSPSGVDASVVTGTAVVEKTLGGIPDPLEADPVVVYAGVECYLSEKDFFAARAKLTLEIGEEFAIEGYVWGLLGRDTDETNSTAVDCSLAIGILEQKIAKAYRGVPVFHMSRTLAATLLATRDLVRDGDVIRTQLGSLVVASGAYDSTVGPDGAAAGTGNEWLYVTGMVDIYRSEVITSSAPQPTANLAEAIAERSYEVVVECETIALLATVS